MDYCATIGLLLGVVFILKMIIIYTGADLKRNDKEYRNF